MAKAVIVLGGGCFWCTEAVFSRLKGIIAVTPGYAGGHTSNPTYKVVVTGRTGHAEVVQVAFDDSVILLSVILDVFFTTHDPTSLNRQGADVGSQYRSLILTTSPTQHEAVLDYIANLRKNKTFDKPIVTEVQSLATFYPAEVSHQEYYQRNSDAPYCQVVIDPKLAKLKKHFRAFMRAESQ